MGKFLLFIIGIITLIIVAVNIVLGAVRRLLGFGPKQKRTRPIHYTSDYSSDEANQQQGQTTPFSSFFGNPFGGANQTPVKEKEIVYQKDGITVLRGDSSPEHEE
jgi:hypothetical protein